ncbi:MAG: hypothetical protein QOI20_422, partial [Acidimicrobiaceae bacterium]|nr:hypothetical protein [Acidimicrobiaceae bacterium]
MTKTTSNPTASTSLTRGWRPAVGLRRMTAGAAALLAASAALVAMAPPAPAMQQASEQVALEKALDKTYPPIPGQWPSSADPTTCSVADFCDTIPIFVHEPTGIPAGDDFYLEVIISWPGGAAADDMDAVLYDNGQTEDEIDKAGTRDPTAPPKASRYTDKKSASDGEPLIIKLPEPRLGQYNLVVVHGLGVSQGYRVQAHLVIQKFVPPFESLEPPDNGVTTQGSDDAPPPDNS